MWGRLGDPLRLKLWFVCWGEVLRRPGFRALGRGGRILGAAGSGGTWSPGEVGPRGSGGRWGAGWGSCSDQVFEVGELGFADTGHLAEFVDGVEAAVLGAVFDDALCQDRAHAR